MPFTTVQFQSQIISGPLSPIRPPSTGPSATFASRLSVGEHGREYIAEQNLSTRTATGRFGFDLAGPSDPGFTASARPQRRSVSSDVEWHYALMTVQFDIRPMVQEYSAIPIERLRVVSRFEDVRLTEISRGVVFVFAAWSGPSVLGFRRFTRVMSELPTISLDLVVLDTDCLTAESATQLFGTDGFQAGGYGETIWVKDGVVVAREIATPAREQALLDHTRALIT